MPVRPIHASSEDRCLLGGFEAILSGRMRDFGRALHDHVDFTKAAPQTIPWFPEKSSGTVHKRDTRREALDIT